MSTLPNLAEILSKINYGICVLSSDGELLFVNEKASQILKAADNSFHHKINLALKDRAPIRFEEFHDSLNRWFEHHTYPNSDGGLTLISCDITPRHRMEEALRASEERFRRVIDSNIIGVIVIENEFIIEANDVFLRMVNYTRDDLERRRLYWPDMTPPEFAAPDEHAQVEIQSGGVFSPYEKELLRKDGRRVPILIGGIVTQRHPDVHETVCLALDLSERRRSEERTKSIVEAGKILASSLEHEKTFPELAEYIVSKIADSCEIYIREGGELIRVVAIPTGDTAEDLRSELSRVQVTGKPFVRAAPASRVLVPITARGKIAGVLSVSSAKRGTFDIEDVRCLEACGRRAGLALEHSRLYYEMQKANRLKDEFLAIVSHELRTPLTPILGGIYMLRSEPRDRSVFARALDLIERNAKTQVQIVDDLLDVSRAMSGKLRLNMEPVDLAGVIQAAVETVWPASEAKGIQIDAKISTISGVILGDADRLQQVVWNLLSNSVKFTPKAGQVAVELVETSGQAEIRVIDTGIGIAAEFLPHVFEKFWQADSSRSRPHGGLGLGLAIVRYLVESHGGTVSAHSQGNEQGSSFIVRLPVRRAARASTG